MPSDNTEHDEDESSDEAEDVSEDEEAPNGEQNNSDHEAAEGDRQESDDDNTRTDKEDADDEDGTREEMGDTNVFSHGFGAQYDAQQVGVVGDVCVAMCWLQHHVQWQLQLRRKLVTCPVFYTNPGRGR